MKRNSVAAATVLALFGGLMGALPSSAAVPLQAQELLDAGVPRSVLSELDTSERSAVANALDASIAATPVSMVTLVDGRPHFESVEVDSQAAPEVAEILSEQPSVETAGVPQPVQVTGDPSRTSQWSLDILRAEPSRSLLSGTRRPVVAVLDTGVLGSHPDLQSALRPGKDFIAAGDGRIDPHGHGTHVAGIIGATVGNGVGVEGFLPNVSILPVRVMDATGAGNTSLTAQGITWATDNGADVINLSLGGTVSDPTLEYAVNYATSKGVSVVAAMGNAGNAVPFYPANYANSIAVGATTKTNERATYSNTGPHIDVAAPGSMILATTIGPDTPYGYKSGTSMATPHVAAVVAGLAALHPSLTPAQRQEHLQRTSVDLGTPGFDALYGHGRIDPQSAYSTAPAVPVLAVPSAPQRITSVPGNASAVITWSAPATIGSSPLSGYTVALSAPGVPAATTSLPASATSATLTGLSNGTSYSVSVFAQNSQGTSISESGHSVVPRTVPLAPVILGATGGDGAIDVHWSAPGSNGGSAVTGYTLSASAPGVATVSSALPATSTTAHLGGLTNNISYNLALTANNAAGTSLASAPVSVTPRSNTPPMPVMVVPGAPSLTGVTPGNASLGVTWSAPSLSGGTPITGYKVTAARTGYPSVVVDTANATSTTLTGLTNGATYQVSVQARNIVGTSTPSNVLSATPRTSPGSPVTKKVTAKNQALDVLWEAPASTGGSPVLGYTVTVSRSGYVPRSFDTDGSSLALGVAGLTNGATYQVSVRARNEAGTSAASNSLSATPRTVPTAPQAPRVTSGATTDTSTSVAATWSAPASTGGDAITQYTVRLRRAGTTTDIVRTTTGGVRSTTFTGLAPGASYTVTVQAHNLAGASLLSVRSAAAVAS